MKIHHIGYLVQKLSPAQRAFEELGYTPRGEKTYDPIRRVDILFLEKDGYTVELVSPAAADSVVSGLIKTYKNAPYHICYTCGQLDEELTRLTGSGYLQIDEPTPAPALNNCRVCFLMHPAAGMVELLEETTPDIQE